MNRKTTTHTAMDLDKEGVAMTDEQISAAMEMLEELTVKHPKQEAAKDRIQFLAKFSGSVSLIVLAGPSGAGKSTLILRFADAFVEPHRAEMAKDPSLVPILCTQAIANGHRSFDFKRLYSDALKALRDPFAASRMKKGRKEAPRTILAGETKASARLREDLEDEVRDRGCLVWIIDEAHHVVRGGKSGHPGDQLDILKSFSQVTGVKMLLSGTYDLPQYLASSGQLARRSETVQLARYHWYDADDRKVFASVVHKIFKHLPVQSFPDVAQNAKYFYVWSVGCVGICKDWIARAFAKSLQMNSKVLTMEHLEATRLSAEQLENISADVERGENFMDRFMKTELDQSLLDRILKKPGAKAAPKKPPVGERTKRPKPGERRVGRDAVEQSEEVDE